MKIQKGDLGYIRSQKKKRTLLTAGMFAIPLIIFITGLIQTKTRLNMFTFVAIMGCLPASRCAVGMIMIWMQKPVSESVYQQIEDRAKNLSRAYELTVTAYEKNTALDSIVICGTHVAAYSSHEKTDCAFAETHITKILKGNGYKADVKIFKDLKSYLDRVSDLALKQTEQEDNDRSHLMRQTILAISL